RQRAGEPLPRSRPRHAPPPRPPRRRHRCGRCSRHHSRCCPRHRCQRCRRHRGRAGRPVGPAVLRRGFAQWLKHAGTRTRSLTRTSASTAETSMGTLRVTWLEDVGRDLRYAVRMLRNSPGFAAVSIATLGVGLGAATAVFSVVIAVLLRPLPYADAERIVRVQQVNAEGRPSADGWGPNFLALRGRSRSFDALAIYAGGMPMSVLADGRSHRANVL